MVEPTTTTSASATEGAAEAPTSTVTAPSATTTSAPSRPPKPNNNLYLPVPIKTFPLPAFYPNNPVSLLHLAYAWLSQAFFPPAAEPSAVHIGVWDPETRSVHVKDAQSIRALWEQGFFGKGSLSRSEPNWLKRELSRRGSKAGNVSEQRTESRREARRLAKWERAKAELEALEQQRREEAALKTESNGDAAVKLQPTKPKAPVGPAELLALPNSLPGSMRKAALISGPQELKPPVGPTELLALPNSLVSTVRTYEADADATAPLALPNGRANEKLANGHAPSSKLVNGINGCAPVASGLPHDILSPGSNLAADAVAKGINGTTNGVTSPSPSVMSANGSPGPIPSQDSQPQPLKRRKSVRFSPTVESTTFQHHDPPSPRRPTASPPKPAASPVTNGVAAVPSPEPTPQVPVLDSTPQPSASSDEVQNKEHYQLAPIEAFFLVFALGALSVVDPVTLAPIPAADLLTLFRAQSYFPPLAVASPLTDLRPQDPFLVDYAVYHHFRSLGWVPRHGIKFGVDFLLYERGPAYNHSHFGVIIMPSFSHGEWKKVEHDPSTRTWSWLMGINRVLAHVLKGLVLVYVDIPPPSVFQHAMERGGFSAALKKFKIHEVMVRRFSVNRNR